MHYPVLETIPNLVFAVRSRNILYGDYLQKELSVGQICMYQVFSVRL